MPIAISVQGLSCIVGEGIEIVVDPVSVSVRQQRIGPCGYLSGIEQGIAIVIGIGVVAGAIAIGIEGLSII